MPNYPEPNPGKKIEITLKNSSKNSDIDETWSRWPVRTPIINKDSDLVEIILDKTKGLLQKDDLIMIAESVVAITQGRAYKFDEIKPSRIATLLSKFVRKVPWGIGLGKPQTMHLAIEECGLPRILLAAFVSALGKLIGVKGLFYRIAGTQAALIDGPCDYTLPPYNKYATLGPKNPQKTARELSKKLDTVIAIVDANDIGTKCIGAYPKKHCGWNTRKLAEKLTKDNPSGQSNEQTPVILARNSGTANKS